MEKIDLSKLSLAEIEQHGFRVVKQIIMHKQALENLQIDLATIEKAIQLKNEELVKEGEKKELVAEIKP